jgi:hypothetical protein
MQRRASVTTSDAARGQKSRRPFGSRRHRAAFGGTAAALRLLSDALRRIACVAAPCIQPAGAGNAARVGFEIVS